MSMAIHAEKVHKVVPRKGDVDRNTLVSDEDNEHRVVPRKGDVDRNRTCFVSRHEHIGSSPARGTWIEIHRKR